MLHAKELTSMVLLVLLWLSKLSSAVNTSDCSTHLVRHGVRRELWHGLNGGYFLTHLTENERFIQNKPDKTSVLDTFNPPQSFSTFYGQRLSAFFIPSISGAYTFVATCDSECKVLLSKDEGPRHQQTIINLDQGHKTGYNEWNRFPEQRSCPQDLESHVVYYLEALHSNHKARDHFRLRIIPPGKQDLQDIEKKYLVPYDKNSLECSVLKTDCGIVCGGSKNTFIRPVNNVTKFCDFTKYIPVKPTSLPDYFLNVSTTVTNSTSINVFWHFVNSIFPSGISEYNLLYSYNTTIPRDDGQNITQRTYSTILSGNLSAVTLNGLRKFTIYCIRIVYIARTVKGDSGCTYAQTHEDVPSMSPSLQVINNAMTSIRVTWQPLQERYIHGVLRGYRIKITNMNESSSLPEVIVTGSDESFKIVNGVKRQTYYCVRILAFTSKGDGPFSECVFILTLTEDHLLNITTITTSSTTIQVFWNFVNNYVPKDINGYRLSYTYNMTIPGSISEKHNVTLRTFTTIINRNLSAVTLTGLQKYTLYCIQMEYFTSDDEGGSNGCTYVKTHEDVPSMSPPLQIMNIAMTSIRVTWQPLQERYIHGVLRGYKIKIINMNESSSQPEVIVTGSDESSITVNEVKKFNLYCVRILAFTSKGDGPFSNCTSIVTWTEDLLPQTTIHNYTGITSFNITWAPLPGYLRTHLIGYLLSYTAIQHADKDLENEHSYVMNVTANVTHTSVTGLRIYTVYRVEIRPLIRIGVGRTRLVLIAATCRCNPIMKALWSPVPPYAVISSTSTPTGLIPRILSDMVGYSCGQCSEHGLPRIIYQLDPQGSYRGIRDTEMDRDNVDFIFPVRQSKDRQTTPNGNYYVPLLEVPGFAFLTSVKTEMAYARQVASSVFHCWPIVAISLSMTVVSGFFLWILEAITDRRKLPAHFYQGVSETVWWAFVTMTTVGYGDRVPKSHIGRVFSIAWFFIGLVTVALLVGSITSSLSVKILNEQLYVKRDKKLASLDNPLDYRALMRVDERATTRTTYEDLENLAEALKVGLAEGIIVDMYMAGFRTDLFNGSWYKVSSILNEKFYYGVNIGGGAARLAKRFQEYATTTYEVEIKLLQEEREKKTVSNQFNVHSQTVRQEIDLLDPSTTMYQLTVFFLLAALGCAVVAGMLFYSWNKNKAIDKYAQVPNLSPAEQYKRSKEEMRFLLETFYRQMLKIHTELKEKHRRQWIAYAKQRKARKHEIVWL
ncbi:uncharacterized protein LOC116295209 isoform X2 [Actinia tenebrosa]|uniref:Uncharacterized protein LOC116295209 isoform X2 n=1 Tax=Actinia tenebrosa TaxID=6105 RepID=A0A6P8I1R8_ACTTE|nr:uncharacterized protein LOC116295209 isoform X2 [Actinia tenebrosa]